MIVKFFKHGKGSESENPAASITGSINYLVGDYDSDGNRRGVDPIWLRGDAEHMRQIVGYGNHAGSFTSGVLRFVEDLDDAQQQHMIDEFERALLPGLDPCQYVSNWVMHRDKGGTELHFLVAGEELSTGKRVNAYYHEKDRIRLYHWRRAMDAEHGFADPDDPARVRPVASHHDLPKEKGEVVERLENYLLILVNQGLVNSREDIKGILNQIEGLEVTRENKKSISVKIEGGKQPFRLRGEIFAEDFRPADIMGKELERKSRKYKDEAPERAKEARKRFEELHAKRAEYYQERYVADRGVENISPDPGPVISADNRPGYGLSRDHGDEQLHHREEISRQPESDSMPAERKSERSASMQTSVTDIQLKEKNNEERKERAEAKQDHEPARPGSPSIYARLCERFSKARKRIEGVIGSIGARARSRIEKLQSDGRELQDNGSEIQRLARGEPGITPELGKLEFNLERIRKHQVSFK